MEESLLKILDTSGVNAKSDGVVNQFEAFLGLDVDYNGLTLEDCTPVDPLVFEEIGRVIAAAWKPNEEVESWRKNNLLESELSPDAIRLQDVWHSVLVTKWARLLIDLHVDDSRTSSQIFMQNEVLMRLLIPALYHHINNLPVLQSQMHYYKQSLQRPPADSTKGAGRSKQVNPMERLAAYERAQAVLDRLLAEWKEHTSRLEDITIAWYREASCEGRMLARRCLGRVWTDYIYRSENISSAGLRQENTQAAGVQITLKTLDKILSGVKAVLNAHERLLVQHLIPLHRPNGLVLWRDQTPVLQLYHESLTRSCALLLQKKCSLIPQTIRALLQKEIFPPAGNTGKQVLLLHELDTYLGLMSKDDYTDKSDGDAWFIELTRTLGRCMASEHSAVAERALQFSKNAIFLGMMKANVEACHIILSSLIRSEPSWNPTVRKMTYLTLKALEDNDEEVFIAACDRLFLKRQPSQGGNDRNELKTVAAKRKTQSTSLHTLNARSRTTPKAPGSFSMPPPALPSSGRKSSLNAGKPGMGVAPWSTSQVKHPPLTITGVAPWASTPRDGHKSVGQGKNPPLTITGVAPWASNQDAGQEPGTTQRNIGRGALKTDGGNEEPQNTSGRQFVSSYMTKLKPKEDMEEGASPWSKEQMLETPTLLPDLKFHDLVFGQDLGEGAFGSVRYARLIDRSKTRSKWAEFAVKVISTEKIHEFGYEYSVKREIAVLKLMSHPSICRLISSFRFREGAYLVLEYAAGGDLHDLLRKKGSLDNESTQFVIGEVMAGLQSIHDLGLAHMDLKVENILITESGHLKLTDFGGCRPVTMEARVRVAEIARTAIQDLRDGDWKVKTPNKDLDDLPESINEHGVSVMENEQIDEPELDDERLEGTTANLPPEIVMGGKPSLSSDSWSLGCVMYQCLTGRPPLLDANEETTRAKIVQFANSAEDTANGGTGHDGLFGEAHAAGISAVARQLIQSLLERDVMKRPSISEAAQHEYFKGVDVFALYRQDAPSLDVGSNAPTTGDSKWSRRQFSTIWAPQPVAYDLAPALDISDDIRLSSSRLFSAPIPEEDEATGQFTPIASSAAIQGLGLVTEASTKSSIP